MKAGAVVDAGIMADLLLGSSSLNLDPALGEALAAKLDTADGTAAVAEAGRRVLRSSSMRKRLVAGWRVGTEKAGVEEAGDWEEAIARRWRVSTSRKRDALAVEGGEKRT